MRWKGKFANGPYMSRWVQHPHHMTTISGLRFRFSFTGHDQLYPSIRLTKFFRRMKDRITVCQFEWKSVKSFRCNDFWNSKGHPHWRDKTIMWVCAAALGSGNLMNNRNHFFSQPGKTSFQAPLRNMPYFKKNITQEANAHVFQEAFPLSPPNPSIASQQ